MPKIWEHVKRMSATLLKSYAQDGMKGAFWKAWENNVHEEMANNRDDGVWLPHEYLNLTLN